MDKANSEQAIKLPIGFRFHPTDEELLLHYLKRKIYSLPLPPTLIPDFEVFHSNPWDLPGDLKEKRYFFCKRKKMNFMNKCSSSLSSSDCGYWKDSGKDKQVMAPGSNLVIGIKKSFIFYQGKRSPALKTQWVMHEFCLVASFTTPYLPQKLMMQVGDWVVCRVYQSKRKATSHGKVNQLPDSKKPRIMNNLRMGDKNELGFSSAQTCSSSSCCSGITEISSNELDEEASSQNIY
ncbi:NAC domain-containing protein 83 [Sesamum alatum]|uniref:NAC domain-containing protein 83 n=1 Tax=Sesamum alatum TaxID=300844 RepID=A0AAE2CDB9_9LAMI|nr:NAC domain-containing protein 83 [Sesamum alatum]